MNLLRISCLAFGVLCLLAFPANCHGDTTIVRHIEVQRAGTPVRNAVCGVSRLTQAAMRASRVPARALRNALPVRVSVTRERSRGC